MGGMNLDSKHFDRLRTARAAEAAADADAPPCSWEGCTEAGPYRAPLGRGREGEYRHLCLEHVRQYNKSYNYFAGMSEEDVAAFQKASMTGHRPTWTMSPGNGGNGGGGAANGWRAAWSGLYENPFDLFDDGPRQARPRAARPEPKPRRHLLPGLRRALDVLGLAEDASKDDIKGRYKALVKKHHPDANNGDRSCEARLRSVIAAYSVLKRAGLC